MRSTTKITPARVLVIDDEKVICDACKLVLGEAGHQVTAAETGVAGVAHALRNDYDLVLIDIKLPDMDGLEILKRIHQEKPAVNLVVMTGYASVENAVEAMKLGAFDYLSKPFYDGELRLSAAKAIENKRLKEENLILREQLFAKFDFSNIIGKNPKILEIFDEIRKAAPTDSTVLIIGESGTGKELFANAIHAHSKRAVKQFIAIDCSTFSSTLLESELFGHVKGAFTGASQNKAGIFEIADGGTLFLDEIANLNCEFQAKLLRVMEFHQYKPVGASHARESDLRVIAATNQDLKKMTQDGLFRKDLYYRLNVLPLYIPPLRDRRDDIPRLAYHFLRTFSKEMGRQIKGFSDEAIEVLIAYDWPGNVRQLKNIVERLVIMSDRNVLGYRHLLSNLYTGDDHSTGNDPQTLNELKQIKSKIIETHYGPIEKQFLRKALQAAGWNITHAAKRVGMQRSNFSTLLKKHKISPR
ncbi:MAG: sigma-54 dependent transcriptional regulator [Deltaproteobacteria bacterium]|nr:sigma-54 dependent transcriptional regulator [Deltaproteobacteria bacterium]